MFQVVYEYQKPWPEDGTLWVKTQFEGEIKISPIVAQHRANGFLGGHVTLMVMAGTPVLVAGKPPMWRIPACLHLAGLEEVITVGAIEVDALTGEIIPPSSDQIATMQRRAHDLATRFALPTATSG